MTEIYSNSLRDDSETALGTILNFFEILDATSEDCKFEGAVIGNLGSELFERAMQKVAEVLEVVELQVGKIEILRESKEHFFHGPIRGVNFTPVTKGGRESVGTEMKKRVS